MITNPLYIVGMTGAAKSGKDTVADALEHYWSNPNDEDSGAFVHKYSFAGKLKEEVAVAMGVPLSYCYEDPYKEAIRPVLQAWGSVRKEKVIGGDPMYWCRGLQEMIRDAELQVVGSTHPVIIIVTDARYDFEAEVIKGAGHPATIFETINPDQSDTTAHTSHSSEDGISKKFIDLEIHNDKSLGMEALLARIPDLAKMVTSKAELGLR